MQFLGGEPVTGEEILGLVKFFSDELTVDYVSRRVSKHIVHEFLLAMLLHIICFWFLDEWLLLPFVTGPGHFVWKRRLYASLASGKFEIVGLHNYCIHTIYWTPNVLYFHLYSLRIMLNELTCILYIDLRNWIESTIWFCLFSRNLNKILMFDYLIKNLKSMSFMNHSRADNTGFSSP